MTDKGPVGGPEAVRRVTGGLQPLRPALFDARSLNAYSVKGSKPALVHELDHAQQLINK